MTQKSVKVYRWTTRAFGKVDNLELVEDDLHSPGCGEVRVSVRAVGLNFAEVFSVLGLYQAAGRPPFTPGFEVSGIIESVGEGVREFAVGERVIALVRFGGYATCINVDVRHVRKLDKNWSFVEGAAFAVQALTAYYAIVALGGFLPRMWKRRKGEVFFGKNGGNVLIHSVGGGVGLIAGEIIQKCGGQIVGTVGREEKVVVVKERLGLKRERIVVREKDKGDFKDIITERAMGSNQKFDLVLDSIGGKYFQPSYEAMNKGGKYVMYGAATLTPQANLTRFDIWSWLKLIWQTMSRPKVDPMKMISENKTVTGFNLVWLYDKEEVWSLWDEIIELNLSKPLIGHKYDFREARKALSFFQSGKSTGKVCLEVPQDLQLDVAEVSNSEQMLP